MKKIVYLLTLLMLCIAVLGLWTATGAAEEMRSGNFTYTISNSKATITGYVGEEAEPQVPDILLGASVVAIGENAFAGNETITSVYLPEGVESIGAEAFRDCVELRSITIPFTIKTIAENAFEGCYNYRLEWITGNYTYIVSYGKATIKAYTGTAVHVTVPNTLGSIPVEGIGGSAFFENNSIETVSVSEGIVFMGTSYGSIGSVFENCDSLLAVTLPSSLQTINYRAFSNTPQLSRIEVGEANEVLASFNGALFNKVRRELLVYPQGLRETSYTVPDGILWIGDYAFNGCSALETLILPDTIISIGWKAFAGMTSLRSLKLPANLGSFSPYCLDSDVGIESFEVSENHPWLRAIDGVLYSMRENTLLCYPRAKSGASFTVPQGIVRVGREAFADTQWLQTLVIPESVIMIDAETFRNSSIKSVTLPKNLRFISYKLFYGSSVESIQIPESVTIIGDYAFQNCGELAELTVPDSVWMIGAHAFNGSGVRSVNLPTSTAPNLFVLQPEPRLKYSPAIIPGIFTVIPEGLFRDCAVENIEIPDTVIKISSGAFMGCYGLTEVTIPDSVRTIEQRAFANCRNLVSVIIPATVEFIEWDAFSGCPDLTVYTSGSGYVVEYLKEHNISYKLDKPDWL